MGTSEKIDFDFIEDTGCWEVTSHRAHKSGYANIQIRGSQTGLHRFVYESFFGEIPEGKLVMHRCDNRICINPEHLKLGTHKQNMADMIKKKRQDRGASISTCRLTEDTVREIKRSKLTYKELAQLHNVSFYTIRDMKRGVTWKYIR